MKKLLENLMGITETKIFVIDAITRLAISNGGSVSRDELVLMKEIIIKESRDAEMGEALDSKVIHFANSKGDLE